MSTIDRTRIGSPQRETMELERSISLLFSFCRTWDDFVDCVSHYTTSCLKTDRRQQQLLTALKESVRTVDEMCGSTDYQLGKTPAPVKKPTLADHRRITSTSEIPGSKFSTTPSISTLARRIKTIDYSTIGLGFIFFFLKYETNRAPPEPV